MSDIYYQSLNRIVKQRYEAAPKIMIDSLSPRWVCTAQMYVTDLEDLSLHLISQGWELGSIPDN